MAFTFTQKTGETGASLFGGITVDGDHATMTGVIGSGPQTADATGTPQTSPLTVSSSAVTTLLIPNNAAQLNLIAATNTINISEADATVASKFFTIPTGIQVTIDVSRCSTLYLKANTGASTTSFWFNVV